MSRSKYATVAEDEDGGVHLFRGKKDVEFSYIQMDGDGDDVSMNQITFTRSALLHLPERMDSDEFEEFTDGRQIGEVIDDCLGLDGGGGDD